MRLVTALSGWLLAAAGLATAALAAPGDTFLVTGDVVNVRTGPGTNYRIRVQLRRGDAAVELGREGEWLQVELPTPGTTGWIHEALLTAEPAPPQPTPPEAPAAPTTSESRPPEASAPAEAALPIEPAATEPESAAPAEVTAESEPPAAPPAPEAEPPAPADALGAPPASEPEAATGMAPAGGGSDDPIVQFGDSVSALNARAVEVAGIDLFVGVEAVDDEAVRVMVTEAWGTVPEAGQRSYMNTLVGRWLTASGGSGPVRVQVIAPDGSVDREATGP